MLSTVYAAEVQFRHDAQVRDRELAILGSIKERRLAAAARLEELAAALPGVGRPARTARSAPAWPRPIGVDLSVGGCTTTACVV